MLSIQNPHLRSICTLWGHCLPPAASTSCAVFLEDCKGVINESCVLITTNSLWGIFKEFKRRWGEQHCPPWGNYKLGALPSLCRDRLKDRTANNSFGPVSAVGGSSRPLITGGACHPKLYKSTLVHTQRHKLY